MSLTLPGNQLSMSALSYLKKFKNCGNKAGALQGWKRLKEEQLGKVHEKKALRGTDKVNIFFTYLLLHMLLTRTKYCK